MSTVSRSRLTAVSIFSGCGGFDLGIAEAGFKINLAIDNDRAAVDNYNSNLEPVAIVADLRRFPFQFVEQFVNNDVLIAGPPCQGFSTIGKRRHDDPRNELLTLCGEIAARTRPRAVIVENVSGVVSGKHGEYWKSLKAMFRREGYYTTDIKCMGTDMGIPQTRMRMVMLAWRGRNNIRIELPRVDGGVLVDSITCLNGKNNHQVTMLQSDCKIAMIANHLRPGQKLCNVRGGARSVHTWDIPEVFGQTTKQEKLVLESMVKLRRQDRARHFGDADPIDIGKLQLVHGNSVRPILDSLVTKGFLRGVNEHYDLYHTFNGKPRRLDLYQPSPTVDTRFGDPVCFLHPTETRGFTVREAARIQGFPDSYIFSSSDRKSFELIGNAVPPPVAAALGSFVSEALLN